ncbi:MAG: hypothetical protein QXH07_02640, partial [Thermoplasmata archaeon]
PMKNINPAKTITPDSKIVTGVNIKDAPNTSIAMQYPMEGLYRFVLIIVALPIGPVSRKNSQSLLKNIEKDMEMWSELKGK